MASTMRIYSYISILLMLFWPIKCLTKTRLPISVEMEKFLTLYQVPAFLPRISENITCNDEQQYKDILEENESDEITEEDESWDMGKDNFVILVGGERRGNRIEQVTMREVKDEERESEGIAKEEKGSVEVELDDKKDNLVDKENQTVLQMQEWHTNKQKYFKKSTVEPQVTTTQNSVAPPPTITPRQLVTIVDPLMVTKNNHLMDTNENLVPLKMKMNPLKNGTQAMMNINENLVPRFKAQTSLHLITENGTRTATPDTYSTVKPVSTHVNSVTNGGSLLVNPSNHWWHRNRGYDGIVSSSKRPRAKIN